MAKTRSNHGKQWTPAENRQLERLAGGNTPTRVTGIEMGRRPDPVASQASKEGISLKPTNRPIATRRTADDGKLVPRSARVTRAGAWSSIGCGGGPRKDGGPDI